MNGLDKLVEELGGNFLLGGAVIQFSDATFADAFKTIYEAGAAAEREACAKLCEEWLHGQWHNQGVMAALMIRARGSDAT
jgi:hypothetical protein